MAKCSQRVASYTVVQEEGRGHSLPGSGCRRLVWRLPLYFSWAHLQRRVQVLVTGEGWFLPLPLQPLALRPPTSHVYKVPTVCQRR